MRTKGPVDSTFASEIDIVVGDVACESWRDRDAGSCDVPRHGAAGPVNLTLGESLPYTEVLNFEFSPLCAAHP